jgi:hypothetical protein
LWAVHRTAMRRTSRSRPPDGSLSIPGVNPANLHAARAVVPIDRAGLL